MCCSVPERTMIHLCHVENTRQSTHMCVCVRACCSVVQCIAVCQTEKRFVCIFVRSRMQGNVHMYVCLRVCCSVLQCVAVWCSVLQCVRPRSYFCVSLVLGRGCKGKTHTCVCVCVCYSMLQCGAACCSGAQYVAVCQTETCLVCAFGRSRMQGKAHICACVRVCCSVVQCVAVFLC